MINIYKTGNGTLLQLEKPEPGCWVSVYEPTQEEFHRLTEEYGLEADFVRSCLDEEESSRVEREDSQTLIIVDTAVAEQRDVDVGACQFCRRSRFRAFPQCQSRHRESAPDSRPRRRARRVRALAWSYRARTSAEDS